MSKDKTKITVRVFVDDISILRQTYSTGGYNRVVRALIRDHVEKLLTLTGERLEEVKVDLTLGDLNG